MPPTLQWQASFVRVSSTDGSVFGAVEMNIGCVWVVDAPIFLNCETGKMTSWRLGVENWRSQEGDLKTHIFSWYPCGIRA